MKNVTLAIEEGVLEAARRYAAEHSTTLNQMVRDFLKTRTTVTAAHRIQKLEEGFALSDAVGSSSDGWKFNREEIYAGRISRSDQNG